MVDVTELVAVQTASCLDAALVSAEQATNRLAVVLMTVRAQTHLLAFHRL